MWKTATFCLLAIFTVSANADCTCTCVNGQVRALCSVSYEVPPVCAPMVCPITPAAVQPITPAYVPPIGTSRCQNKQILNPYTNMYEWRMICQ